MEQAVALLGDITQEGTTPVREAFAQANLARLPRERYELIGRIDRPIPCDVYAAPTE